MGLILTVALVIIFIGYLLAKDDIGAVQTPDIQDSSSQQQETSDDISATEIPLLHEDSFGLADYDEYHLSWNHQNLHNPDDLLDPSNLLSPLNPVNLHSSVDDDSSSSGLFDDSSIPFDHDDPFD